MNTCSWGSPFFLTLISSDILKNTFYEGLSGQCSVWNSVNKCPANAKENCGKKHSRICLQCILALDASINLKKTFLRKVNFILTFANFLYLHLWKAQHEFNSFILTSISKAFPNHIDVCIAEFMVICRLIQTLYIHGKTYGQWIFYIYSYGKIISGVIFFIKYLWIIINTWVKVDF